MLNNTPILCGGDNNGNRYDTCISYKDSKWSQSHLMVQKRSYAAGLQINYTTFWILGGSDACYLDTSEFIIQGQTNGVSRPKLPYSLFKICVVKLSENE